MGDCMPRQTSEQVEELDGTYELQTGCVLLLDEIDKAPADVPNALLEVLNPGQFLVNETGKTRLGEKDKLFVVVTSNSERNLPAAFLRRCAVLQLTLGDNPVERLLEIAEAHRKCNETLSILSDQVVHYVADYVIAYRDQLDASGYRPGTSEFLDLLTVIAVEQKESELSDEALKDLSLIHI